KVTLDAKGASRIMELSGNSTTTISGLSFVNGKDPGKAGVLYPGWGGAIVSDGTLTVNDCVFDKNTVAGSGLLLGGSIYNEQKLTLNGCTFTNSVAASYGGAVMSNWPGGKAPLPELTVTNCKFGLATDPTAGNLANQGSAISSWGKFTLTGSTFAYNGGFGAT